MSSPILWGPNNTANNLQQNFNQTGRFVGAAIAVPWASGIVYAVGDLVVSGNNTYYCKTGNTGGADFASDFALGYWSQINTPIVGKNYVQVGSNFETNTVEGWQLFNIAGYVAGSLPSVAPTIGSATSITVASTATNPLDGKYSLQVSNVASTNITAGHGIISQVYTIDIADQAKVLATTLAYQATTGASFQNYSGTSSNTWALYIYDVTNSAWIQPAGVYNLVQRSGVGKCSSTWQTPSNMTQFRIALLCINSTSGSSPAVNTIQTTFDDFYCGPQPFSMGPAMSEMQSYTPTVTGSSVNPTLGTGATQVGYWQRVGQNMKLWIKVISGTSPTPGTGYYEFSIPDFATIDTTYIKLNTTMSNTKGSVTTDGTPLGVGQAGSTTLTHVSGPGTVIATTNKKIAVNLPAQSVSTTTLINQEYTFGAAGSNLYDFGTAGVGIFIQCEFAVVGWGTNTIQSADTDTRVVSLSRTANTQYTVPNSTYVTLDFGQNVVDTHSGWRSGVGYNSATGTWTTFPGYVVPVSGYYYASVSMIYPASANERQLFLSKNFSAFVGSVNSITTTSFTNLNSCGMIYCNAGDFISVAVYQNSGGSLTIPGSLSFNWSSIQIQRLSGPAVVQATETVAARYYSTSNSAWPTIETAFNPNIKDYDTHNGYNSTTGIYTVPVSGKYRVTLHCAAIGTSTSNTSLITRIYGGPTAAIQYSNTPTSVSFTLNSYAFSSNNVTINCNAGDQLKGTYLVTAANPNLVGLASNTYIEFLRVGN